ncbi:MAG: hypothetical protein ACI3T9_05030 [Romboutsia timonensis]
MYKNSKVKVILYLIKWGIVPAGVEVERREDGSKKFVFLFDVKSSLVDEAKQMPPMTGEEFTKYYDLYWNYVREFLPWR